MNVDNLIFYSEAPLNDGADEVRDDVDLFSSIRDDEIDSNIMLLECLSGASNQSDGANVIDENEQDEEGEEHFAAIDAAVDLHVQISTEKPPEMQYFSQAYGGGFSFDATDDEASVLLPTTAPNKVPSTPSRSGGPTKKTLHSFDGLLASPPSSSPTFSTLTGPKPHTPRRLSLRSPMALTPKKKIGNPFSFKRNGSGGWKESGHVPFINKNEDEQREPPEEEGSTDEEKSDAYILVNGTWISPQAQEEWKNESKPETEWLTSAKKITNTTEVDRRTKTFVKAKSGKRADTASPSPLQENKKDIGSRQRVKITVTEGSVPRNATPAPIPAPVPAPIPAAPPAPISNTITPEFSESQILTIATSAPDTAMTELLTTTHKNSMVDDKDEKNEIDKDFVTKSSQVEVRDKSKNASSESVEKLRRVYSRTLEIVKDLSKSEAEHEIVRMLNQNIVRALGTPTGDTQHGREVGTLAPVTENGESFRKGSLDTSEPTKKSSIQSTTGKKLNVSFNLSEDIHYYIQETFSATSPTNDSSSFSDGSNEGDVGSSHSVVSEDYTYDSYSSIGADHDACGKVNEILAEIRHVAEAFNIFNEDRNPVGADDFSASTADATLESDQEQLQAAMSEAFSFRRKANVSFLAATTAATTATTSSPSSSPAHNQ